MSNELRPPLDLTSMWRQVSKISKFCQSVCLGENVNSSKEPSIQTEARYQRLMAPIKNPSDDPTGNTINW